MSDVPRPIRLDVHSDARGFVFEPLAAGELEDKRNVHVAVTMPGEVRGNHYHRELREEMAVRGPALVRVRRAGVPTDFDVPAGEVHRFRFDPGVSHAVKTLGDNPGLLVVFGDREFDPESPDAVADRLLD